MVEMMTKFKQANRELEDSLRRLPSIEELSEYMKMPRKKLNIIKKAVKAYNSPTQSGSADGEMTINELVADTHNPGPDDEVMGNDDLEHLASLLDRIDSREAKILKLRYGLDGRDPMTLKEIGAEIGLTRDASARSSMNRSPSFAMRCWLVYEPARHAQMSACSMLCEFVRCG